MSGTAQAFIAFLRCEATQAEERAKSLRATAAAIEANNLKRKRRREDGSATKEHNAYSMFLKENLEAYKKSHPHVDVQEIHEIISRQWEATSEEEKMTWRMRAEQMNQLHDTDDDGGGGKKRALSKKERNSISI